MMRRVLGAVNHVKSMIVRVPSMEDHARSTVHRVGSTEDDAFCMNDHVPSMACQGPVLLLHENCRWLPDANDGTQRMKSIACTLLAASVVLPGSLSLGAETLAPQILNSYLGSEYGTDSTFIPPDTMGAVGQDHLVELLNGRYSVYRKSDGARVQTSSLNTFWINAGVTPSGSFAFDPRVVYDPFSLRWYAGSVDNSRGDNSFLIAVSNSSDPTTGWTGFKLDSDSADLRWADFPTLGIDEDGVYMAANMFPISGRGASGTLTTLVAFPKSDLLAATPTIANATKFENQSGTGFSLQPVVDMDHSGLPMPVFSAYNTSAGFFKRSLINGPISAPTFDSSDGFITVPAYLPPLTADQPGAKANIDSGDTRFSANLVLRGGIVWGVQSVFDGGGSALRWFKIDAASNTLLEDGLISDPSLSFYYGSIAVNQFSNVVIGFSGSDSNHYVSTYAVVGQNDGSGNSVFGSPVLLRAGVSDYQRLDTGGRNRWGDYSATVLDPTNSMIFWTFQERVVGTDKWGIEMTEIILVPEPGSIVLIQAGLGLCGLRLRRRKR
jgi:hypothetical protein